MKKIGLFYATEASKNTSVIAQKIQKKFTKEIIDVISIEKAERQNFEHYENLILGVSTWFDGELPTYWDELIPELETAQLKNKKVAIFGLGDQKRHPDNFADGIGILAEAFENAGASIVGFTSPDTYEFNKSRGLRKDMLVGLVIDIENQDKLTDQRINNWVEVLKKEFT